MSKTKLETLIIDVYKELMKLGGNQCSTFIFGPEVITVVIKDEPTVFNAERIEYEACKQFMADCGFPCSLPLPSLERLRQQAARRLFAPLYNEYVKEEVPEFLLKLQAIIENK